MIQTTRSHAEYRAERTWATASSGSAQIGLWAVLHEIRSEYAQLKSSLFLLLSGPGPVSLDAALLSDDDVVRPGSTAASLVRPSFGDDGASVSDRRRVSGG